MSSQFTTVFLFIASLLTTMVLGLEILRPFAAFLPPHVLHALEWQIYLHSSALAFGAVLFVLYQVFFAVLFVLFSWSLRLLKLCGIVAIVENERGSESEEGSLLEETPTSLISPKFICSALLVTILILNDAIYNRVEGSPLIRGSFDRLFTIILQALPMCVFEIPALLALVYLISLWNDDSRKTERPVMADLEAQTLMSPSHYLPDTKLPGVVPEKSSSGYQG